MSMTTPPSKPGGMGGTPPGWYADQGAPGTERWWDGAAWTAHTRPLPATLAMPVRPAPNAPSGRGTAAVIGALLVVPAVIGGVLLLNGGGDEPPPPVATSSAPAPVVTSAAAPTPSPSPTEDPTHVTDQLNGITLPILKGWKKPENTLDDVATVTTDESYECPGDTSRYCDRGTVSSRSVSGTAATTPEALAKEDIATAAKAAYGEDALGNRIHGGIRSHTVVAARPAVVAGRTGYLVRWRVITGKGPGGYVQSLVFPSSLGSESPVVVRFAFDAGPDGPPLSAMDEIMRGIKPIGSSTGGGVGSSIGP
ncbi:DUF2510 domain-containing protein [Streptomyces purpureus]|uniref:DUF2510 domain-containing protein n=1 Tax=Streptomyces purpureus TaxID=1951 RepID=UPI0037AE32ED